ncbi:MAG: hypothetical protein E7261_05040 [Lachnospiraceae bacterium]|nr:hypothetical protein [Lachnospiraceae bacterium]
MCAHALLKKMFYAGVFAIVFWSVLCVEVKYGTCGIRLSWYGAIPLLLSCVCVPVCDMLLGKVDYEVACLKEMLQIHRLSIFLGEYSELGMEENIKWIIKACDKYYGPLRWILLYIVTGRDAPWKTVADSCGESFGTRLLRTMWARILEHIKELDVYRNKERDSVFKNQYEYAEKLCDEHIKVLLRGRVFMCKIIAYLPVFATILFYMIYPFVLEGIKLLNMYSEEMKSLGLN